MPPTVETKARHKKFGAMLRAYRMGFRWSDRLGGFLRMSWDGETIVAEFLPEMGIAKVGGCKLHICWWEGEDVLELSPAIRALKFIKEPFTLRLDSNGRAI